MKRQFSSKYMMYTESIEGEAVGVVCILVISVDMHPYFTGIAPNIIFSTNTIQNFTIA